jgi:hypothetical protein
MSQWPRGLPPPKDKRAGQSHQEISDSLDSAIEVLTTRFGNIWDRSDALLAIAERAMLIHVRDAIVIDGWNAYVKRENAKRRGRRLRGWRNGYYVRAIHPRPGVE